MPKSKVSLLQRDYKTFADSAWFGNIKPTWVPYLIDNNMLTEAQKDTIEANIAKWKDVASPGGSYMLYIVIALLVIIIIVILFVRRKPKKPIFEADDSDTPKTK